MEASPSGAVAKLARRSIDDLNRRIEAWFRAHIDGCSQASVISVRAPVGTGLSGETYIVALALNPSRPDEIGKFVLRKSVVGEATNPQINFDNMVRVQSALGEVPGSRVPKVVGVEFSDDILGSPFFAMAHVEGEIPSDVPPYTMVGWVKDATPEQRTRMWRSGMEFLVYLHGLDWQALHLESLRGDASGDDDVERTLNNAVTLFRREGLGRTNDLCERAIDWLLQCRPKFEPTCISWGDARIGNIVWRDFTCVAALDWDMCTLGTPGMDVAWWSFFHRWSSFGMGFPDLPGTCVGQDLVDLYTAQGGRKIENIAYFEILAAVRGLSIWLRTYDAMRSQGVIGVMDPLGSEVHIIRVLRALMDEAR